MKVNVDAGELGEIGHGLGVVVRDSEGSVLACATRQGGEVWEALIGEAKAMVYGMQIGKDLGLRNVVFESDCQVLVNALRGGSEGCSSFSLIIDDILHLCSDFDNFRWSFVKCSGNKIAHDLAHFQPWEFGQRIWDDEFPECVLIGALADLSI